MRLLVTKPYNGLVDLELRDRGGFTGLHYRELGVPVANLKERVAAFLEPWQVKRQAIRGARRGRPV